SLLGPDEIDRDAEQAALERIRTSPVPVSTMCGFLPNPERDGLMVVGPDVDAARLWSYTKRLFVRMEQAGIGVIGYGSGGSRFVPDGFPRDQALEQVRHFLQMCATQGEGCGVRVALEPYNRTDANLINTVPEALRLVREVNRPSIQLMADFFHMRLNGESFDELMEAGPHLIHAHIAEPGRGHPQTTPEEHAAYLQILRSAGYDGRVTQTGDLPAYGSPVEAATALKEACRSS
ncbi:MAG: sugar phosphate isomerase/epimerase, partial [Candidatus Poribacteria bacterium]|nr:sugar phosphate isomerase/epimerase [Candidatus Poribacteria bacterium]